MARLDDLHTQFKDNQISFQSYAPQEKIQDVHVVDCIIHDDDGGSFAELCRLDLAGILNFPIHFRPKQINISLIQPGVIKAFHLHPTQTDCWMVPPTDRLLLVLHDLRPNSKTYFQQMRFMLGSGKMRWVVIPPGVAHGVRNLGRHTGTLLYMVDQWFSPDPERTEECRVPWDTFGADIWEQRRE
jgi:dTDP-4-dehydrorhamnose 3,5-epimerase